MNIVSVAQYISKRCSRLSKSSLLVSAVFVLPNQDVRVVVDS